MGGASFKVDLSQLKTLANRFEDPMIRDEILAVPKDKAIGAIIGQGIDDNFQKEGPGWKPKKRPDGRPILQGKTRLLKASATQPMATGNVYKVEGTNITWGTNLKYAAIHNYGGTIKHPGTNNGFGKKIIIPPHSIGMPKRTFMVLSDFWKLEIFKYAAERIKGIIDKHFGGRK